MGEVAATKSGIADWARINEGNSERDAHRVMTRHKTTLDIPVREMDVKGTLLSWINPRDWFQFIVTHGLLYMLSGLPFEQRHLVGIQWQQFWIHYKQLNPDYDIFFLNDIDYTLAYTYMAMRGGPSSVLAS